MKTRLLLCLVKSAYRCRNVWQVHLLSPSIFLCGVLRKPILATADELLLIINLVLKKQSGKGVGITIVHLKSIPIWVPLPEKCIASVLMSASPQHSECNQSLTKDRWDKYRFGSYKHHGKSCRDPSENRNYSHQKDPNDL